MMRVIALEMAAMMRVWVLEKEMALA